MRRGVVDTDAHRIGQRVAKICDYPIEIVRQINTEYIKMKKILLFIGLVMSAMMIGAQSNAGTGNKKYAVIDVSVGNIRTGADFETNLETQALLGQPVKILATDNGWYQVKTPDGYVSWINHMQVVPMAWTELRAWNAAAKVVVISLYGFTYSRPSSASQTVSDVVAGDRLRLLSVSGAYYYVAYPDGRRAYIAMSAAQKEKDWFASRRSDAVHLITAARSLIGIPYLWGGTSSKGVDCSGMVWTSAFLNGLILPRNASSMIKIGERLTVAKNFANLIPGDLVFFGRKATAQSKERVSHVGIYIGNRKFIHSLGMVHISSFNPKDAEYDAYDLGRFIGAVRFLNHIGEQGIIKIQLNQLYQYENEPK